MAKVYKKRNVLRGLEQLGFEISHKNVGSHIIARHRQKGLFLTIPNKEEIPYPIVRAAIKQSINFGIASEKEIESLFG